VVNAGTMQTIVDAGWWLAEGPSPATLQPGPVRLVADDDGTWREVGPPRAGGPEGRVVGSNRHVALPGLANAHDHAKGLRALAYGVPDAVLETWLLAVRKVPAVDPYIQVAAALCRGVRSGTVSVMDCHAGSAPGRLEDDLAAASRAAADVGVRLAFGVPMSDRNWLVYGGDEGVLAGLDPTTRAAAEAAYLLPDPPVTEHVALVEALGAAYDRPGFQVQFHPRGPQWCSDELIEAIAESSERTGRRVHTHLFETPQQRAWADAAYPKGLIAHLDELGLLSERLTVAHAVWVRPEEQELLAERGVVVSINSSSNLRLRSGIAPVGTLVAAGACVAVGMDGQTLDDDDDILREHRLAHLLHAGIGFDAGVDGWSLLAGAARQGGWSITGDRAAGQLAPGAPADAVVLALDALAPDAVAGLASVSDLVLGRARAQFVTDVVVAGRHVVAGGKVTGVDEDAIVAEQAAQAGLSADAVAAMRPVVTRVQAAVRAAYAARSHELGDVGTPIWR
jgi:cytosine/adenosine deaminase-related metal-dependent hydrolase